MLRGELTNLRAIERHDDSSLYRWLNDPEVMRGWGLPAPVVSVADIQRRIESWLDDEAGRGRPAALMVETLDGEPVGLIILISDELARHAVQLSLLIGDADRWGQGLGGDALATLIDACFLHWHVHRIQLRSEAGNDRAHRLYRRLGFQLEGTLRDATWMDGRFEDQLVFGRLASDREPPSQ
jgi:RimJ/RimL family protein N-acetyltransferase